LLAYGFAIVILIGTGLLLLPISRAEGTTASFLDSLFTATSAVTVTGLIVVDTSSHWSTFGKGVLLALIQIGGLGFMTSSTLILLALGRRLTLRERLLIRESLGEATIGGLIRLVRTVALVAFVLEAIGTLLFLSLFRFDYPLETAAWMAGFHSVSAFNNAGFWIFPDTTDILKFRTEAGVLIVFAALIMLGGIGYTVLADVIRERRFNRFTTDTKMVLVISLILWAMGLVMIFVTEYNNPATLGDLSVHDKVLNSFFMSVTARTAGFSPLDVGNMKDYTLFFLVFLMIIGAASGSTGGGLKVNTFGVIFFTVLNTVRGREGTEAFQREIPREILNKAVTLLFVVFHFLGIVVLLLIVLEGRRFIPLMFESISAFATVGLGTGITPDLSTGGKLLIIATMFVGRVGPLTLVFALAQRERRRPIRYAEDHVKIG
jgi:trk system potassium uptake protein TrkH